MKQFTLKNVEDNYTDYSRLLNAKLIELENRIKAMMASFKPVSDGGLGGDKTT